MKLSIKLSLAILSIVTLRLQAQTIFEPEQLMTVGTYYYPEHWPEEQWERDITNIAEMGFEFTHFAEFAWAQLEPTEGNFDFTWLDKAVQIASDNGLKIVMCTPTPTPPRWLTYKYPEILIYNDEGRQIQHGARAQASWSSDVYRRYVKTIVTKLAERYGQNPDVIGWQIDNEPSHYGGNWDYSPAARDKFRVWLKNKYGTIEKLNTTWGNDFWSQNYNDFGQIEIPNQKQLVQQANPHAILDFRRFTADEAAGFISFQADLLEDIVSEKQWITTNFMPGHLAVDPRKSKDLDFVTYTKYIVAGYDPGHGETGFRVGSASNIGMSNDFFRTITGTTGVMELQPGQVNWGQYNPQPLPGVIRMWLWHAFAGDCKLACNYRYRQPIYGGEQFHYGMVRPDGTTVSQGGKEYVQFLQEVKQLRSIYKDADMPKELVNRKAAIVYDLDSRFEMNYQPQTDRWSYMGHMEKYYNGLKSLGAPVDIVDKDQSISEYPVVVVPAFELVNDEIVAKWKQYVENGGNLIVTTRTAMKNREARLWEDQWAAPITKLLDAEINLYDHLPSDVNGKITMNGDEYAWNSWGETLAPGKDTKVLASYADQFYKGQAAIVQRKLGKGTLTYVGVDSKDGKLEKAVVKSIYEQMNVATLDLPEGVVLNWRDGFWIGVNYSDQPYVFPLSKKSKILVGEATVPSAGVIVWKESK